MYQLFEIFLAMGSAWAIIGLLRITILKRKKTIKDLCSIIVIAVFLFTIFDNLLRPTFIPMGVLNFIYPITRISYFLVGPSLLFYVSSLLEENFKLVYKHLLHLIPFIIWFIYILIDPVSVNPKISFASEINELNNPSPIFSFAFIWDLSLNLSRVIYSCIILNILRKHSKSIEDEFSTINKNTTLVWIKYLLVFYTGIYLIFSIMHLILAEDSELLQISAAVVRTIPAVLFVFLFSLFSEKQPILIPAKEEAEKQNVSKESKYQKSGITDEELKQIFKSVVKYVESSKIYLDSELTLNKFSEKTDISRHKISQAINLQANKRFYLFINEYRLEEFINSIKEDRYPSYTLISIAYECGFKSSSSFYTIIKNKYNVTPKVLVQKIKANEI
ncbi:MAG: AraC family transcriptional regulator [Sphaerochaetaceae bacterium]|nr:AraC family transcriptional regulator [Sphaerochaetaceae bacterium]